MHRPALFSILLVAVLATGASRALAEASDGEPFSRRPATGAGDDGTEFLGTLYVQRFAADADRLVAIGSLSGQLTRKAGAVSRPVKALRDVPVRVPVTGIAASCSGLKLDFAALRADPAGPAVSVDPLRVDEAGEPGALARNLRCSLAERLGVGAPTSEVATLLNGLLKLLA